MTLFNKKTKTAKEVELVHISPVSFEEAKEMALVIKAGNALSVDFSNTPAQTTIRLVDFITGTLVMTNGSFEKIAAKHYILAPNKEAAVKFANAIRNSAE